MKGNPSIDPTLRWFWSLAIGHLILWTAVPTLTQANLPLDNVEMLCWGQEWQWGYYKHPPLPAWSAEVFAALFGDPVWSTYLLSQLCIVSCLWAAWRLGREALRPWQALAAATLLESSIYYNCTTPEFNNNIMAKACWALFSLFLYWSMVRGRLVYWAMSGIFLGAAFLSKYDVALLLIAVLVFSVGNPKARRCWRTPGPYVLFGVALLLFAPHAWWLISNGFPTIRYAMSRATDDITWLSRIRFPVAFLGAQLGAVAFILLLSTFALGWRWRIKPVKGQALFHRSYVTCIALGPLLIALLLALCAGLHLRSMWGASMFTFLGVLLFAWFESKPAEQLFRRLVYAGIATGMLFAIGLSLRNLFGTRLQDHPLRVDFPGKRVAVQLERIWNECENGPLTQIGGDWWVAANASVYNPLRPSVFAELNEELPPWCDDETILREGALVVWDVHRYATEYGEQVRARYPLARVLPPIDFVCEKTPNRPPLRIGVAVVPATPDASLQSGELLTK